MQHMVETLPGGTKVWVNQQHRVNTDALLLANFCQAKSFWRTCDLGSGSGVILLSLADAGLRGNSVGIEQDEEGATLLEGAIQENHLQNLTSVQGDMRKYASQPLFDLVVSNPPYFTAGFLPQNEQRARTRHQISCTIQELCATAARLLKDGGRFCICYPASQLSHLFFTLQSTGFAPKRLQLARKHPTAQPWLVLVDARKAGGIGLSILPDYILVPGQQVQY